MAIRVTLDLSEHCVQTAARRAHRALQEGLLTGEEVPVDVELRLQLLKELLETTDFRRLRAERPELAGGHPVQVVVERGQDGRPRILPVEAR